MKYLQYHGKTGFILPRTEGKNARHYSRYRLVKYEIFTRGEVERLLEKGYEFPASHFEEIVLSQFTDEIYQNLSTVIQTPGRDYSVGRSIRFPSAEYRLKGYAMKAYEMGLYMNESYSEEQERSAFEKCQ